MEPAQSAITPPVQYAAEIAFELNLMRGECSSAARSIVSRSGPDEPALEECACLDDALAVAYQALQSALTRIVSARASRS